MNFILKKDLFFSISAIKAGATFWLIKSQDVTYAKILANET